MSDPQLRKIRVNGVQLAYFERNQPKPGQPTLLFVHATGFHGRIWDRIIEPLQGHHSIALEQRGHGRSEKVKIRHWKVVGQDVAAVIRTLDLKDIIGVGHSMGAHALVQAAADTGALARLMLLDPTIMAPEQYQGPLLPLERGGGVHPAAKRRNHFASVEEMMHRLATKSAFPLFDPRVFRDYCQHGLVPAANGGLQLACPPEIEASVYMASRSNPDILASVAALDLPVLVVRAKAPEGERGIMDFASSPTWPGLAGQFRRGREIHRPDITHFIPMQIPDEVSALIAAEIEAPRQETYNPPKSILSPRKPLDRTVPQ